MTRKMRQERKGGEEKRQDERRSPEVPSEDEAGGLIDAGNKSIKNIRMCACGWEGMGGQRDMR